MGLIHPKFKQSRKERAHKHPTTEHPDIPSTWKGRRPRLFIKIILTKDQIAKPNPKAESQIQNKYQDSEEEKKEN